MTAAHVGKTVFFVAAESCMFQVQVRYTKIDSSLAQLLLNERHKKMQLKNKTKNENESTLRLDIVKSTGYGVIH